MSESNTVKLVAEYKEPVQKDGKFFCPICNLEYKAERYYRIHFGNKHMGKVFHCEYCPYQTDSKSHLKRHKCYKRMKDKIIKSADPSQPPTVKGKSLMLKSEVVDYLYKFIHKSGMAVEKHAVIEQYNENIDLKLDGSFIQIANIDHFYGEVGRLILFSTVLPDMQPVLFVFGDEENKDKLLKIYATCAAAGIEVRTYWDLTRIGPAADPVEPDAQDLPDVPDVPDRPSQDPEPIVSDAEPTHNDQMEDQSDDLDDLLDDSDEPPMVPRN